VPRFAWPVPEGLAGRTSGLVAPASTSAPVWRPGRCSPEVAGVPAARTHDGPWRRRGARPTASGVRPSAGAVESPGEVQLAHGRRAGRTGPWPSIPRDTPSPASTRPAHDPRRCLIHSPVAAVRFGA
jgi:hypothetical protein